MITKASALHDITDVLQVAIEKENLVEFWNSLTDIQRNEWVCWTTMAKQEATREKRLRRAIEEMKDGDKTPCCWPGCPHRNPNNAKWFK